MAALLQRLRRTRLLSAALLLLMSACAITGCGDESNRLPTAVTTSGTATAIAVASAQSTATAPANLPAPTANRVPTPTRVRAWTAAEQAYVDKVGQWGDRYAGDLSKLNALLAGPDPLDGSWASELNNAMANLDAVNNEVLSYPAPGRFSALHGRLTKAADYCEQGSNLVGEGITEFDPGKLERGATEIETGAAMIVQAVDDVGRLVP
jgi:hypothetical protein